MTKRRADIGSDGQSKAREKSISKPFSAKRTRALRPMMSP